MKRLIIFTKFARNICGAGLILAAGCWTVLLVMVLAGFVEGGADGARGNLHRLILGHTSWGQLDRDPVAAVSRGYEGLVALLLITWAIRELYLYFGRKLSARQLRCD